MRLCAVGYSHQERAPARHACRLWEAAAFRLAGGFGFSILVLRFGLCTPPPFTQRAFA